MKKYYLMMLAALMLLTSCGTESGLADSVPMSHIPIGIEILALIGLVTVIVLLFGFILFFGGLMEYLRQDKE